MVVPTHNSQQTAKVVESGQRQDAELEAAFPPTNYSLTDWPLLLTVPSLVPASQRLQCGVAIDATVHTHDDLLIFANINLNITVDIASFFHFSYKRRLHV